MEENYLTMRNRGGGEEDMQKVEEKCRERRNTGGEGGEMQKEEDKCRRRIRAGDGELQCSQLLSAMSCQLPPLSSKHIFANVKTGQNFQKVKKEGN